MKKTHSSWDPVADSYSKAVGEKGLYYHERVIFPHLLKLMGPLSSASKVVDLGCGQGIFSSQLPLECSYLGLDSSSLLIKEAKSRYREATRAFAQADLGRPLPPSFEKGVHTHAVFILSLQNIENGQRALQSARELLEPKGRLFIVLNHPCFRIPRSTSWVVDAAKQIQYRRIDRYLSSHKVSIEMHPGSKSESPTTWSFHHSLSDYSQFLRSSGFVIEQMQEWCSDKKSEGGRAKLEDFARAEFPLFLGLVTSVLGSLS